MSKITNTALPLAAACLAILSLGVTPPAAAQPGADQYDDSASTLGGVTVISPRRSEREAATGAPIETVFATRIVRDDDLDLSRPWDMHVLRVRVERAAHSACDELDRAYPITASESPPCVREAVRRAMYRVEGGG